MKEKTLYKVGYMLEEDEVEEHFSNLILSQLGRVLNMVDESMMGSLNLAATKLDTPEGIRHFNQEVTNCLNQVSVYIAQLEDNVEGLNEYAHYLESKDQFGVSPQPGLITETLENDDDPQ